LSPDPLFLSEAQIIGIRAKQIKLFVGHDSVTMVDTELRTSDLAAVAFAIGQDLAWPAGLEGYARREITGLLHCRLRNRQTSRY
jgi:hypothetical protein